MKQLCTASVLPLRLPDSQLLSTNTPDGTVVPCSLLPSIASGQLALRVIHADPLNLQGTHYRVLIGLNSLEALAAYVGARQDPMIRFLSGPPEPGSPLYVSHPSGGKPPPGFQYISFQLGFTVSKISGQVPYLLPSTPKPVQFTRFYDAINIQARQAAPPIG